MATFPILEHITVDNYGLYPGVRDGGLDVPLKPGLTFVLGANGLGKTTLVTLLYRMCTGPCDIRPLDDSGELGTRSLAARPLSRSQRRLFAERVADGAEDATATLQMTLGNAALEITRALNSLELLDLRINGTQVGTDEDGFQDAILTHGEFASFGDWILVLQHLIFYFETRRSLVWDPSAQRQILRILLLPPDVGAEWSRRERHILEIASAMRNLSAALTKEESQLATSETLATDVDDVRAQLALLEKYREADEGKLNALEEVLTEEEAAREAARLATVRAEAEHESAYRDLERRQLLVIASAFPDRDDTARYLLGKLFSEDFCLACGHEVREMVATLEGRQAAGCCVVCNTPLEEPSGTRSLTSRSIKHAAAALEAAEKRLATTRLERENADLAYHTLVTRLRELQTSIAEHTARINALVRRLPPEEASLHTQRAELSQLRGRVEVMRANLDTERGEFASFIERVNKRISRYKRPIQDTFAYFAEGFLLEICKLVWAPHPARVGESGASIMFPSFELDLSGANFPSPVRRHGPQQVSESQREFIDLAFRMTLMRVVGKDNAGTLVIDAPESSLDAVFVKRAAEVLTRFATAAPANRLVVTSNLVEGDLIPELAHQSGIRSPEDARVVDLLQLAAPTAATRKLSKEYRDVRRRLFERAAKGSPR